MQRPFGNQGFTVSALGLGAGQMGDTSLSECHVGTLLNRAVDLGVTLIDTARSYGLSEQRIGRHLAHRRSDVVLSTKVGYGIAGHLDWTYDCVIAGVDHALRAMRTDHIDIAHLHSCPLLALQHGGVIEALHRAREQGKVRVVAYSGENDELAWSIESGQFGGVECSVNLCDQRSLDGALQRAHERGIGVIAKRAVANAPWRFAAAPHGDYPDEYWRRWQALALDPQGLAWQALALRFATFAPGVSSAIFGSASIEHLAANVACVGEGPLPEPLFAQLRQSFRDHGQDWAGLI